VYVVRYAEFSFIISQRISASITASINTIIKLFLLLITGIKMGIAKIGKLTCPGHVNILFSIVFLSLKSSITPVS
jgi:hypothetical protein